MHLRRERKGVDIVAGDASTRRDALGGTELVGHLRRVARRPRGARPVDHVHAQTHPAHRLDPAHDPHLDGVGRDEAGDEMVGLCDEPHWQSTVVAATS